MLVKGMAVRLILRLPVYPNIEFSACWWVLR